RADLGLSETHGGYMNQSGYITNEVHMLKSKLETMDGRIGSAGVDVSNVSRGSWIDAREIMERVRKSYNVLIRNVPETDKATNVKVAEDVLRSLVSTK
ncbi:hypothetical protein HHI36_019662, partial [Cryptolaemus montrouzieri]